AGTLPFRVVSACAHPLLSQSPKASAVVECAGALSLVDGNEGSEEKGKLPRLLGPRDWGCATLSTCPLNSGASTPWEACPRSGIGSSCRSVEPDDDAPVLTCALGLTETGAGGSRYNPGSKLGLATATSYSSSGDEPSCLWPYERPSSKERASTRTCLRFRK